MHLIYSYDIIPHCLNWWIEALPHHYQYRARTSVGKIRIEFKILKQLKINQLIIVHWTTCFYIVRRWCIFNWDFVWPCCWRGHRNCLEMEFFDFKGNYPWPPHESLQNAILYYIFLVDRLHLLHTQRDCQFQHCHYRHPILRNFRPHSFPFEQVLFCCCYCWCDFGVFYHDSTRGSIANGMTRV